MRLAVIQQLPLEYYPPVTNLLTFLRESGEFELRVFTVENTKGRAPFEQPGIEIVRTGSPSPGDSFPRRLVVYASFLFRTLLGLLRFRPEAILYFEPHSALPVTLHRLCFHRRTPVFIHHHEYYEPHQFERPGMRLSRLAHRSEQSILFPVAQRISQTNGTRRELFLADHPRLDPDKVKVMPNFPPAKWLRHENRAWPRGTTPFRLVYIGSLSLEDTFLEPLVSWLESIAPPDVELDLFGYNVPRSTGEWLAEHASERLRFHSEGVSYDELPDLLADYHAGLVLYRGNTANFVWNAPNKLFEYLACGLDVWYPPVMKGILPWKNEKSVPRVLEVPFDQPDAIPIARLRSRGHLPSSIAPPTCERVYRELAEELKAASDADSAPCP